MGGCRCTYRKCESSTASSPGLHYFHFPVRDPQRCNKWIENARKPAFRVLSKDKLRNKVICSLHFEERCFTNERHDRLIHSAVPTLGFEDDDSIDSNVQNSDSNTADNDIMLIPIDDNNTKFALPNVEFPGMSYTIFDDTVIPTSKIEEVIIKELEKNPTTKMKDIHVQSVVQKIKTTLPLIKTKPKINPKIKSITTVKTEEIIVENVANFKANSSQNSYMFKDMTEDADIIPSDSNIINQEKSNNNIATYSVSTGNNGEVSVEPTHIIPDIINDFSDENTENSEKNTDSIMENIQIEYQNENEYNVAITPVSLVKNIINDETTQNGDESETNQNEIQPENNINAQEETNEIQIITQTEAPPETNDEDYVKMIKNHTKEIKQLKNFVHRQSRFNQYLWQRNKLPNFRRKMRRHDLIRSLKKCVKPSLLAILKLELLPQDDIFLTEKEEKFISDLYMENPECYNILRTKFGWKLPATEKSTTMEVDS